MATTKTSRTRSRKTKSTKAAGKSAQPKAAKAKAGATATSVIDALNHDQVARRAFEIWMGKGRPLGCDEQNWLEAEKQLIAECVTRK